ncbi:hypothetical protein LH612_28015 [Klebsiella pneumoniae]|nr:hypothetical protein [Klebsiella pneumoniae]
MTEPEVLLSERGALGRITLNRPKALNSLTLGMVRAMTEGNRAALLDALDDALGRIGAARGSLASTGSLKSTIDSGYSARESYAAMAAGKRTEQVVRIPDAGALLQLRELGDQGARVVALDEESATVVVPV